MLNIIDSCLFLCLDLLSFRVGDPMLDSPIRVSGGRLPAIYGIVTIVKWIIYAYSVDAVGPKPTSTLYRRGGPVEQGWVSLQLGCSWLASSCDCLSFWIGVELVWLVDIWLADVKLSAVLFYRVISVI